jgi:hypothetical protein
VETERARSEDCCCRRALLWCPGDDDGAEALAHLAEHLPAGPAIALHVWRGPQVVPWAGGAMLPPVPLEVLDPSLAVDPAAVAEHKADAARACGFTPNAIAVKATGAPWRTVLRVAADRHAHLIGVLTRGTRRDVRAARRIAALATVPVLIAGPDGMLAAQRQRAKPSRTARAAGLARPA